MSRAEQEKPLEQAWRPKRSLAFPWARTLTYTQPTKAKRRKQAHKQTNLWGVPISFCGCWLSHGRRIGGEDGGVFPSPLAEMKDFLGSRAPELQSLMIRRQPWAFVHQRNSTNGFRFARLAFLEGPERRASALASSEHLKRMEERVGWFTKE